MNKPGITRAMKPKTFEIVKIVSEMDRPFTVREIVTAHPHLVHTTVCAAIQLMANKHWIAPQTGLRRQSRRLTRAYVWVKKERFPIDVLAIKVFQAPKPQPVSRPLFRRSLFDRIWEEFRRTFTTDAGPTFEDVEAAI